jgi:hypothetical protein
VADTRGECVTNFKSDPEPCVCGCGTVARPRAKAWSDGLGPHAKTCPCRRCNGSRYKRRASARERGLARRLPGGERQALSGALNGADVVSAVLDVEETAAKAYSRGLFAWWDSKGVRKKTGRLLDRRLRPRAFVVWDDSLDPDDRRRKRGLSVMPVSDLIELCEAAYGPQVCAKCGEESA